MARSFFALALVALFASASASLLPTALRQVVPADAVGTFVSATFFGNQCPKRITHGLTDGELLVDGGIPHSAMTQNGNDCNDGGSMTIYMDGNEAANAVNSEQSKALIRAIIGTGEPAIYGVEKNGRRCGGSRLGRQTVIVLLTPSKPLFIGAAGFPANRRIMLVEDPNVVGTCQYRAPLRVEETPEPETETPAATPTDGGDPPVTGGGRPKPGKTPEASPDTGSGDGSGAGAGSGSGAATPTPDGDGDGGDGGIGGVGGVGGTGDGDGTPTDEPTPEPSDEGSVCFPADATVEIEDGSVKKMVDVQIGDRVKVADGKFSDVYMFTHKEASTVHEFVTLATAAGETISATKGHYIYINGKFAAAGSAKVGDLLQLANGASTTVENVSLETKVGLFNPQTVHGDIIVNSIRASTFTRTIEPCTAQAMLAPFRMMYGALGWSTSFLDHGADMVAQVLPKGSVAL